MQDHTTFDWAKYYNLTEEFKKNVESQAIHLPSELPIVPQNPTLEPYSPFETINS